VAAAEEAALAAGEQIVSVTTEIATQNSELLQLHSNGFVGRHRSTGFFLTAAVTAKDADERRPEDHAYAGSRYFTDLPRAAGIGQEASRRALERIGAAKAPSAKTTLIIENRAAGRMVGSLLSPLHGSSLQQRRSCFEGMLGEKIGSELLTIVDDPLVVRGLASRRFDGDGLPARRRDIFDGGALKSYFIDVYYGRKLQMPPTTGAGSNIMLAPGDKNLDELLADVGEGILVTSFLGGNANPATGDFSFGVSGFAVHGGKRAEPINEMNIADNHTAIWKRLSAVGNDPYLYTSWRIPTLVFDDVQFSGS
jgi:PmbA protein